MNSISSVNNITTIPNLNASDGIETDEMYKEYANTQWVVP